MNALIHPERMNQDWKPIKKDAPLFIDMEGNTKTYTEESFKSKFNGKEYRLVDFDWKPYKEANTNQRSLL